MTLRWVFELFFLFLSFGQGVALFFFFFLVYDMI